MLSHESPRDDDELVLEDSDDEFVDQFLESHWEEGVETGLTVKWPGLKDDSNNTQHYALHLSTKLPETSIVPLFDGTGWAGTRVWKAALSAVQYMEQHCLSMERPLSLLELGCGLGVPGMLWHKLQLQIHNHNGIETNQHLQRFTREYQVLLTDQPSLVSQLEANLQSNFPNDSRIKARPLPWNQQGLLDLLMEDQSDAVEPHNSSISKVVAPSSFFSFDICLNCDCIYEPLYGKDAWMALADVLAAMAKISPRTILITSVERRVEDGLESFLQRLEESPFVSKSECVMRNDQDKHHVIEIYITTPVGRNPQNEHADI